MSEIVVADSSYGGSSSSNASRPITRSRTVGYVPEPFDSEKLPQFLISEVRPLLRVANQLEKENPRVAHLCRIQAFVKAHTKDPNSSARGVRQFKTALLQRLEQDEQATFPVWKETSNARELESVYHMYKEYILKHEGEENREELLDARATAAVLSEVLRAITSGTGPLVEVLADGDDNEEKSKFDVPYNILPLDRGGSHQAIMQFPEIKAAVAALRNIRGLPLEGNQTGTSFDLLDWLQCLFKFQKGNVDNQREHLILLLANIHVRQTNKGVSMSKLGERAVDELVEKLFENYTSWCKFLGRKSNIRLPSVKQEVQQYKILYMGLYLLIWGEASNVRFMPECLCYIFHHMAYELHGVLCGHVTPTGEKVKPAYGEESESFLKNVITPIYRVIYEEAQKNKNGVADHSKWRNYDDLNEYFWSLECFQLGWPMRLDCDFFYVQSPNDTQVKNSCSSFMAAVKKRKKEEKKDEEMMANIEENRRQKWLGKTNFVEIRSFWHLFRSFDRMWTFFILALQVMIIMAWHGMESLWQFFDATVLEDILSIFITSAVLKLVQAILEIVFTWKARHTMDFFQRLRHLLKLLVAVAWTIILPVCYAASQINSTCNGKRYADWIGEWCISSYMVAVALYLVTNAVGMVLFFVPAITRYMETSNRRVCTILSWWAQPRLYVGRGMQENLLPLLTYTSFWVLLLLTKIMFSYHFEIKPLVEPTKQIMSISVSKYEWHELFPKVKSNAGAIIAVWSPVILVYFMDTQIWYSIFCTIVGGAFGVLRHLGEIRTLGMLRSRFQLLPSAFSVRLVPPSSKNVQKRRLKNFFWPKFHKVSENEKNGFAKFALVWNKIISSLRSEDLISNRETDLMTIPLSSDLSSGLVRWPVFLLATEFSTALSMARDFVGEDENLFKKIKKNSYMYCAVKECYELLKNILDFLLVGDLEKRVVSKIQSEVQTSICRSSLLLDFKMSELPTLHASFIELVGLLFENKACHKDKVVKVLQDIFEVVTKDMMIHGSSVLELLSKVEKDEKSFFKKVEPELFVSSPGSPAIRFPFPDDKPMKEQTKRLFLMLTVKETALEIPMNLEAKRRISFFATSLFMDMPMAPKVRNMLSFSVMTPHYMEEVKFSMDELFSSQEAVSIMFYMQKIYPDEWTNFQEREGCLGCELDELIKIKPEELRNWASFRGQTLSRTVRGMMYYREALKLQAFLDMAKDEDMKFTHVISCQMFGAQKSSGDPHAQDILDLMIRYPSLRVAYVEEKEEIGNKHQKIYSSILVKAVNNLDQEIYRVKLPGPPNIGEGKPENQNHAIIFTRGDAVQTIDMNQDNSMEEALKIRNVLQEFLRNHGLRSPTILGLREHIFTGSVASLAWFMSYQETSFVTIGQRVLANPLRVRFHYGHPDLFDRVFHLTRGGISKASKTINLTEDVFAGFNSTLRRGYVTYHEYIQIGKGRDVGLNQISKFEAKITNGNSEQSLSRDIYRLGCRFDFFRMLSCYFTTVGFYFNSLLSIIGIYVFLYGQLYLILSGLERAFLLEARMQNIDSLETALASQSFIQLGLLTGLPMVMEIGLERGFFTAFKDFILMQLQLASVFFTFSFGTRSHYYGRTILHGGAKYRPTGRKVVVSHASFTENYRLYSRSHFVKGFELLLLLIVYNLFRRSYMSGVTYVLITYFIWFMVATWLFAPFLFNPSGFNWGKIMEDWKDWNNWIKNEGNIGVQQDKSWESWWEDEQNHLRHSGMNARIHEILLSLRFFLYQYGLVYHLDISHDNKNFPVYLLSWLVIAAVFLLVKGPGRGEFGVGPNFCHILHKVTAFKTQTRVFALAAQTFYLHVMAINVGRQRLGSSIPFLFRFLKAVLFLGVLAVIITLCLVCQLSVMDLVVCCLAFIPTGWGLLLIAQAVRPLIEDSGLWNLVLVLAQSYDYGMGAALFAPVAILAWLPIISAFQTRFLFNEAYNRRLQIHPILPGKKKKM
ncbi:putative callose synthase 8 isoform X2 [Macadamia integrifolia]|uniref:putative callose synthase 8 isoform X2 n=1 Tax=Macadamia integrifolia TaxID=60698 RepID=UPI001C4E956E|nr:putative callose synthase 8 isoform X2 [Macadamia integrifolia]